MDNQVLSSNFETHYGEAPALIAHAPGRVNVLVSIPIITKGSYFRLQSTLERGLRQQTRR